jgi:hypothetical protein
MVERVKINMRQRDRLRKENGEKERNYEQEK